MKIDVIRPIPPQAVDFIKRHEACKLTAYLDSAGIVTAGVGHVARGMNVGQAISMDQADAWLSSDLHTAAERLETAVGEDCIRELTDNQYAALVSFVFNVGCDPKWTICQRLKAKQFDAVPGEMMRFVWAGGKKIQGLVNRRADEVRLFCDGEPGIVATPASSSVTRTIDTPPTEASVKPLTASKSFLGSCVAAVCTTGAAAGSTIQHGADQAASIIAPYVGKSAVLSGVADHLALVAAAAAVAVPALLWVKNREARAS